MSLPWIKLVLAISLDGRIAFPEGGKCELGGRGDRAVLEEALAWSDAVLLGAGTLRSHQNTCLIHSNQLIQQRKLQGRPLQPIALIVSNRKEFSSKWSFFKQPISRWLITKDPLQEQSTLKNCFDRQLVLHQEWGQTLDKLKLEGLEKIVLLGGPNLASSMLIQDKIDELHLTIIPRIVAGQYTWIPQELQSLPMQVSQSDGWILEEMKELADNEILIRYLRNRNEK